MPESLFINEAASHSLIVSTTFEIMVLLHVKLDGRSLFLYETNLTKLVGDLISELVNVHNGRLKVLRVCDELEALATHGPALAPEMRGLLEEQIKELNLRDDEIDRCAPEDDTEENKDPLGKRCGRSHKDHKVKEMMQRTATELKQSVSPDNVKASKALSFKDITTALKIVRGCASIAYPMGLPTYDPLRMELENREEAVRDEKSILNSTEASLWFADKELSDRAAQLGKVLGVRNEKTKAIVKLSTKKRGRPASEPIMDEETQKKLMLENYKRMEELKRLESDGDDSYLNSPWADGSSLRKKFQGLSSISWKP